METQNQNQSGSSSLDNDAVNLAKAIRQTESGGNFQAKGKSGEYGAYQFTKPTWDATAKKYGVNVSLDQATPEQQNEVAYKQIKEWKDSGHNVGQIASLWNSGKPDAYLNTEYKGVNKFGANYDVPAYAKSVATAYQTIKNGGQVSVDSNNPSSVQPQAGQPDGHGFVNSASIPSSGVNDNSEQSKQPEKKDGIVKSFAKSLIGSPLTMIARPFQLAAELSGVPTEKVDEVSKKYSGGLVAPAPKGVKDVGKDVLRGAETVALGYGARGAKSATTGIIKALGGGPEISKPFIQKIVQGATVEGETLTRDGAITRLTAYLNNMPASAVGSEEEQTILKAIKEFAPTLKDKQNIIVKIGKSGLNLAAKTALYKVLGDTLGGLVHGATSK